MIDEELTGKIIKIYYRVYNVFGHGFIERVYHNAMIIELVRSGLVIEVEKPITVYYENYVAGTFSADLLVENKVIVELKSKASLVQAHEAQLINYLRATDIELGLLFNFGKQSEFKRKYFSNKNKRRSDQPPSESLLRALLKEDPPASA